ncbi:VOC family protein [Clostridium sp. YIM B02505]|uniref:VOC family protein n=1 Tax=Clostridium yunnanense TaxID=2800325 RepID=A0ABS1EM20_9CLOT|nr:VOC family protein [Clostridium yunnanense]MBK1810389.1 VOC family protein [Clostridium yunnanense]
MNFCWVTLYVKDMEESLKFYNEIIGLKIAERFNAGEEMQIAMLGETDGPKVELIYDKNQKAFGFKEGISIGFQVESLDKAMELLKDKDIPIKRGPISPNPSTKFFFVDDPNGIEVQIVQH